VSPRGVTAAQPVFFATPAAWRKWLTAHHASATELWVGFHKRGSGMPSITWPESVDGALCFGWIDGIRKSLDASRYVIRFTPRRARSIWSTVNTKRYAELERARLVRAAGRRAFAARREERAGVYSFEQDRHELPPAFAKTFRAEKAAWAWFQAQAPWYRRTATWWVISAKKEETRLRRLATLIADCAAGRPIKQLARPGKSA
jgi:uncharacterized protein YdeI (YjbR/CyaY-like superfamily)